LYFFQRFFHGFIPRVEVVLHLVELCPEVALDFLLVLLHFLFGDVAHIFYLGLELLGDIAKPFVDFVDAFVGLVGEHVVFSGLVCTLLGQVLSHRVQIKADLIESHAQFFVVQSLPVSLLFDGLCIFFLLFKLTLHSLIDLL
jgi:hypothetical protein